MRSDAKINFQKTPAASESDFFDLTFRDNADDNGQETAQFAPFSNLTLINTGTTNLRVAVNERLGYDLVPAGTIVQISDDQISKVRVTNMSSSASGEYTLTLDSVPSQKEILKNIAASVTRYSTI